VTRSIVGIADIAFASRFSDISYFYRRSRGRFAKAPAAFRVLDLLLTTSITSAHTALPSSNWTGLVPGRQP